MQFIDLHRQYDVIESKVNERIKEILSHKHFIGGAEVSELEKRLAEYVGVKHVIRSKEDGRSFRTVIHILCKW